MMTAAKPMTDEDLRLTAVGLADGDIERAERIFAFIRPGTIPEPEPKPDRPFKDREQDWRWSNVRCYAVLRAKDDSVVFVDRRENDLSMKGAGNGLSWPVSHGPGPFSIYVFDRDTGRSGYVGTVDGWSFVDDNIAPDTACPLPIPVAGIDPDRNRPFYGDKWRTIGETAHGHGADA